jgi:hypothetical protein
MWNIVKIALLHVQDVFPKSWWRAAGHVIGLVVDNNPGLSGCVPLMNTTVFRYNNTQISGLCNPNAAALELQQQRALSLLLKLLGGCNEFNDTLQRLLHRVPNLGNLVGDGVVFYAPFEYSNKAKDSPSSRLGIVIEVADGVEYVTSFSSYTDPALNFPILKLQHLSE